MKTKILLSVFISLSGLILAAQTIESMKKFEPKIRDVEEIQMIYYSYTGSYMNAFNEFGQLMAYCQSNNLPLGTYSIGLYYDDPELVAEENLRSEVGYMLTAPFKETNKYKYKKIPAGKAVSVRYTSMDDIYPAYEAIGKYIQEKKLKTAEFSIEIYYSSDPTVIDAEILMLIKE